MWEHLAGKAKVWVYPLKCVQICKTQDSQVYFSFLWLYCSVLYMPQNLPILSVVLEKAMAPHSSTLAWKIPWTEEPGRLQTMGLWRVGHDWATSLSLFPFMHWRRKWQPTPVFLPGESQERGEPGGLPSMGSHRVGHDWSDLAAAAASVVWWVLVT